MDVEISATISEADNSLEPSPAPDQINLWSGALLNYIRSTPPPTLETKPPIYPIMPARYFPYGWNSRYQHCYTEEEIALIQRIQTEYAALSSIATSSKTYFQLIEEQRLYGWWSCTTPSYPGTQNAFLTSSFTLPSREARDPKHYPLWSIADNTARQIANWQAERAKDQATNIMNDPVMLIFYALRELFFDNIANLECKRESIHYIAEWQSFIKTLIHVIPHFGPDRLRLHDLQHSLEESSTIIANCIVNKALPELLSDMITAGKNLESTIRTYLHFIPIDEPVAANFAPDYLKDGSCYLSPLCKIYSAVQEHPTYLHDHAALRPYKTNKFYHMTVANEADGLLKIQLSLKKSALNNIKFPSFVTETDKENYLHAIATMEELVTVRETLESFQDIQSRVGTYLFAINYLDNVNDLASNYVSLIKKSEALTKELLTCADHGLNTLLKNFDVDRTQISHFEKNLRALETRIAKGTTVNAQLEMYCKKTIENVHRYQSAIKKLVSTIHTGSASQELLAAMQTLSSRINHINLLAPALLEQQPYLLIKAEASLTDTTSASDKLAIAAPSTIAFSNQPLTHTQQLPFDYAMWDNAIRTDPITHEPIFTLRVYIADQKEVGSATFYGQPMPCVSEDKSRHNLIATSGVLSQLRVTSDTQIDEICRVLPPTVLDKVLRSARASAIHGFFRGGTNMLGVTLQAINAPSAVSRYLPCFIYYSSIFMLHFNNYYTQMTEEDDARYLHAMLTAAIDTGQIWLTELSLKLISTLLNKASVTLESNNFFSLSKWTKRASNLIPFSLFACNTIEHGIFETSAALLAGSSAQFATEKTGEFLMRRF